MTGDSCSGLEVGQVLGCTIVGCGGGGQGMGEGVVGVVSMSVRVVSDGVRVWVQRGAVRMSEES